MGQHSSPRGKGLRKIGWRGGGASDILPGRRRKRGGGRPIHAPSSPETRRVVTAIPSALQAVRPARDEALPIRAAAGARRAAARG